MSAAFSVPGPVYPPENHKWVSIALYFYQVVTVFHFWFLIWWLVCLSKYIIYRQTPLTLNAQFCDLWKPLKNNVWQKFLKKFFLQVFFIDLRERNIDLCSTDWGIHGFIFVCAVTGDRTHNVAVSAITLSNWAAQPGQKKVLFSFFNKKI